MTNYAIISDLVLVGIGIIAYLQYYRSFGHKIKVLQKDLKQERGQREDFEQKYLKLSEVDGEKIEGLLREIDELRKEKEEEVRLRLGAEKQVEMALKKVDEIEKRMKDWRLVQEAAMNDSQHAIEEVGDDIYKKLSDSYKEEVKENKNLINKISQNIMEIFAKKRTDIDNSDDEIVNLSKNAKKSEVKDEDIDKEVEAIINQKDEKVEKKEEKKETKTEEKLDKSDDDIDEENTKRSESNADNCDHTNRLISDYIDIAKAGGHVLHKNYFIKKDLEENKAKLFLCDFAFINSKKIHIMDFKICHYLFEYHKLEGNKDEAKAALKKRMDKYITYLSNEKYALAISKVVSSFGVKTEKNLVFAVVPNKDELKVMQDLGFEKIAKEKNIEIIDFDNASNIIL